MKCSDMVTKVIENPAAQTIKELHAETLESRIRQIRGLALSVYPLFHFQPPALFDVLPSEDAEVELRFKGK